MSDQFNRGGKNDGNRKYQSINLSQHFHKRDIKSAAKATTGRGLQSLGKVGVATRRLPRPAVCSSLKKENAGNDPNVALVPGGGGWGSKKETGQVELAEGEKGWKDVDEKPAPKNSEFTQEFPSLGQEGPSDPLNPGSQKLELRPQTVKWGEKQQKQPYYNVEDPGEGPLPATTVNGPPHAYGVVHMTPVYGVVPVPGVYPGGGTMYHPMYPGMPPPPPGTAPPVYPAGTTPPLHLPYMYTAPPANSNTEDKSKAVTATPAAKGPDHWEDEVPKSGAAPSAAPPATQPPVLAASTATPEKGYISPYTLPFPGTPGKAKTTEQVRAEPVGKPSTEPRITYHGRTSSHSSLSEPAEEESHYLAEETESRDHDTSTQSRVLSRPTVKKELKAFPKEDEMDAKVGKDHEEIAPSWDEEEADKSGSVWDERQKMGNVWNVSGHDERGEGASDRFFEEEYQAEQRSYQGRGQYHPPQRQDSYEDSEGDARALREERRVVQGRDHHHHHSSEFVYNKKPHEKSAEQPKLKQITIQQKPKVEILQKPPAPKPATVQSVGAPSGNYWKEKQAERERQEAEEERKRQEAEKFEAQRRRQEQYQDYRTPDQYSGSAFDEDQIRQYEEEREKRSIRRRGHDEFYDNDGHYDRNERPARRNRRHREEVFRIEYREPRESHSDSKNYREGREYRGGRKTYDERRDYQPRERSRDVEKMDRRSGSRYGDRRTEPRRRAERTSHEERFTYDKSESRERVRRSERSSRRPPRGEEQETFAEETQPDEEIETPSPDNVELVTDLAVSEEETSEEKDVGQPIEIQEEVVGEPKADPEVPDSETHVRQRRDPRERYEKERYENPNFTTYRREPHSRDRNHDFRRDQPRRERRTKSRDNDSVVKPESRKPPSSQKSRTSEKPKSESRERRPRPERAPRHPREGQEWVQQSKEPRPKSQSPSEGQPPERAEKVDRSEASGRRSKKLPSLRYYSANPADRVKSSQSLPPKLAAEEKLKERAPKSKSSTRTKEPKKESQKKETTDAKATETNFKSKPKDSSSEPKKIKKIDNTKFEMERLKKMSQAGMDLLTLGIYAVDGKELDDHEADDFSEGFVEVVRKKSKKDAEPEKKPAVKSKKSKKSAGSKSKKAPISQEESSKPTTAATAPPTVNPPPSSSSPTEKAPTKPTWVPDAPSVDVALMSNIWSNTKKNAWEKPLNFEKQSLDTRDILAPISGESSSLFSSDADLARKTKEKNWRGADARPPRFSKAPEQKTKTVSDKKVKSHDLHIPGISGSALDLIPPVVEDLFGIRSDEEDDKPSLSSLVLESKMSSLVLDTKISAPVPPPVVGLSQRSGTSQRPDRVPSSEEVSSEDGVPDMVSAETSTQTTPPAARHGDKQTPPLPSVPVPAPLPAPLEGTAVSPPSLSLNNSGLSAANLAPSPLNLSTSLNPAPVSVTPISVAPINSPLTPLNVSLNESLNSPLTTGLIPPLNASLNQPLSLNSGMNPPLNSALNPPLNSALNPNLSVSLHGGALNPTAVKQLITSTNNLSLTEQLMEIGQSQLAAAQQSERGAAHFFTVQDMQGSPLQLQPTSQTLQTPILPSECALPAAAPFGHYVTPQDTSHIVGHQLGEKTPTLPLIGPHSSALSSLGAAAAASRGAAGDMFKSYMSPISPASNKIYPLSSQTVQAAHFMSASHPPNYSPSMSPIPAQLNAFPRFQHKSTSPKLQNLYNTPKLQGGLYNSPQGSFETLDPSSMMPFSHQLHKPANTNLNNQHLFYQRLVPGQEIYYKMKPPQNILLQSDMSKHVDAKPFNPGANQPVPAMPNLRKPEIVAPHPLVKEPGHRAIPDFSAINGMIQQCLPQQPGAIQRAAIFPQMRQEQFIQQPQQQSVLTPHQVVTPGMMPAKSDVPTLPRSMPRVKLARDGRMHRVPDMRTSFMSLIPPAVQQHMQQQSLAQIQSFQEALARGEDPATKETLPDNMKPTSKATTVPPPAATSTTATSQQLPNSGSEKVQTDEEHSEVVDTTPEDKGVESGEEQTGVKEDAQQQEEGEDKGPEKKAEKRKFAEVKSSYRRARNQGYPPWDDYHGNRYHGDRYNGGRYYDDGYHDDRYHDDRCHDDRYDSYYDDRRYRGDRYGMRGGRFGPPPMYRSYPPPPPPRRRGLPPRHRDNGQY